MKHQYERLEVNLSCWYWIPVRTNLYHSVPSSTPFTQQTSFNSVGVTHFLVIYLFRKFHQFLMLDVLVSVIWLNWSVITELSFTYHTFVALAMVYILVVKARNIIRKSKKTSEYSLADKTRTTCSCVEHRTVDVHKTLRTEHGNLKLSVSDPQSVSYLKNDFNAFSKIYVIIHYLKYNF